MITQVVVNLLENAIRHSGDKGGIEVSISHCGDNAVVEVSDHGKGLSEDTLEQIRQGKQVTVSRNGDSSRGMGIGLSVCQSIIKAHKGYFEAENRPQGGAIFRFGLPMEEDENENHNSCD